MKTSDIIRGIQDIDSEFAQHLNSALVSEEQGSSYTEEAIDQALDYCETMKSELVRLHDHFRNLSEWTEERWF